MDTSPKDRLLDAAEKLFGEKSFADVSVRDLAAEAGANVAAVNYHFQGKENLYQQVITRRFIRQRDRTLSGLNTVLNQATGRPQLDAVIRSFVGEYLGGALSNSFLTVVTRDMHTTTDETLALFFKELISPLYAAFSTALLAARPQLKPEDLSWIIASVIGQMHHFILRRIKFDSCQQSHGVCGVMESAFPALGLDQDQYVSEITDHVARFSTAAIDGMYSEEK